MVGRVLLLIAAFLVAGLGALLVYLYAEQADQRALAQFETVDVVVVRGAIPAGTPVASAVEQGLLETEELPGRNVPGEAVGNIADVSGLVVLNDLVVGETLVRSRVGNPADQERIVIPEGQMALSFAFQDPERVAGFVAPGSDVAVLVTYTPQADTAPPSDDDGEVQQPSVTPLDGSAGGLTTRVLLDRVRVLAVGATGSNAAAAGGEDPVEVSQTILTLALTKDQAESVVLAQSVGPLYLGLLRDNSDVPPGDGVNVPDLFEVAP